jgi:hypothetical protein
MTEGVGNQKKKKEREFPEEREYAGKTQHSAF